MTHPKKIISAVDDLPVPRNLKATTIELDGVDMLILEHTTADTNIPAGLTNAETDIVHFLSQGMSSSAIAKARKVSRRTIDNQLANIYRKLRVRTREELLAKLAKLVRQE